jgi:RuvB-like protein 2
VALSEAAMSVLTTMAVQTTLRYALNLIATAQVLAQKRRAERVDVEDLRRAYAYFMDEKRSVQWLKEQQGALMFEEVGPTTASDADGMDQS